MESYDKIKARNGMTILMNRNKNITCKNSKFELADLGQDDKGEYKFGFKNEGCTIQRRLGSAYCQSCSDKHKVI